MPIYFQVKKDDSDFKGLTTKTQRDDITFWQTNDLRFNFHEQHTAGEPLYIEPSNRSTSQHPKILTKGKTAANFSIIDQYSQLGTAERAHMREVVSHNWDLLVELAQRYYLGQADGDQTTTATKVMCPKCHGSFDVASLVKDLSTGCYTCPKSSCGKKWYAG